MSPIASHTRRRAGVAVRIKARTGTVAVLTAAIGGLLLTATTAAQAQAATSARAGHPVTLRAGSLSSPAPIALNTLNWSGNAGFGSRPPAWYTDGSGVVHLQGAATLTTPDGPGDEFLIGTLPPAAAPAQRVLTVVHTFNGTYSDVIIETSGQIYTGPARSPAVTDFTFLSLEGITFRPAGRGTKIAMNTADWSPGAATFRPPAWFKDSSGIVHLQGATNQTSTTGSNPSQIGTLPPAARPASTVYSIVATNGFTYADVAIEPNGSVDLIGPRPPAVQDYGLVSLESISYRPASNGTAIPLNTANWNGSAGFGSRGPAWYKDKAGIIHLQGAVHQVNTSGTNPNLIGTLPRAARPSSTVYTIVHTFNGTYADLAIEPNGTLDLINPRAPLVTDYTFVSLESITYRR
jgi:hypothetical protein